MIAQVGLRGFKIPKVERNSDEENLGSSLVFQTAGGGILWGWVSY